jgi:hypothetical protein
MPPEWPLPDQCADTRIYVTSFCLLFATMTHDLGTTSPSQDDYVIGYIYHAMPWLFQYAALYPPPLSMYYPETRRVRENTNSWGGYQAAYRNSHDIASKYILDTEKCVICNTHKYDLCGK